jgi:hypothetical protein
MASAIAENDYRRSPLDTVRVAVLEDPQRLPPVASSAGEANCGSADEGKGVNVVGAVRQGIGELDYVVDEHEGMNAGDYVVGCADEANCEARELGN